MNKLSSKIKKIYQNEFVKDSSWSLFGTTISKGLGLFAGIFIARWLGKDLFGEYGFIKNTIMACAIFSSFGLGYTATKYIANLKNTNPNKIRIFIKCSNIITLIFSIIIVIIVILCMELIPNNIPNNHNSLSYISILPIVIIFNALTATQIGILAGLGEFKKMAKTNILIGISTFIISCICTYFWLFDGAIVSILIIQVLNWLINQILIYQCIQSYNNKTPINKNMINTIICYSLPIALHECVYSVSMLMINLVLVHFSSYGELGLYNAAQQWFLILLFIPNILRNVILSHLSNAKNLKSFSIIMQRSLFINIICTLLPAIVVIIFSGYIAKLYGSTYNGLNQVIIICALSTIFTSISNVYTQAYMSSGQNWKMLLFRIIETGITFSLFFIIGQTIKKYDALIMSWSILISGFLFFILLKLTMDKHIQQQIVK